MATNFLEAVGTNGFIATPFAYMTTEFSGNSTVTSTSVNTFTQVSGSPAQAIWGSLYFQAGGSMTPAAGGAVAVWFLRSPDGGVTFEKLVQNQGLPRAPDAVIPLYAVAYTSGDISWCQGGFVKLPWETHKVFAQALAGSGVSIPTSSSLRVGPVAVQY